MNIRKETIRWIAVWVALALLFAGVISSLAIAVGARNRSGKGAADLLHASGQAEGLAIRDVRENGVHLAASPVLLLSDGTRSASAFEKTLTATVLPSDAPDKTVDWSVAWASDASRASEDVGKYITVTPTENGSNVARVRCLKAFEGDGVVVTVTTRVGGFTATCRVEYRGIPQTLTVDTSGKSVGTDPGWNLSMVELSCGQTHTFPLSLDNELHAVGSSYGNYTFSMEAFGAITTSDKVHSNSTGEDTYSTGTESYRVADLRESDGYMYSYIQKGGGFLFGVHVSIENGQLAVRAQEAISSYYSMHAERAGYLERTFSGYADGKIPYVAITVTETNSGLSQTILVKTVASVTQVRLSDPVLAF